MPDFSTLVSWLVAGVVLPADWSVLPPPAPALEVQPAAATPIASMGTNNSFEVNLFIPCFLLGPGRTTLA